MFNWIKSKFTKQKDLVWPDYLDNYKYTDVKRNQIESKYYKFSKEQSDNLLNLANDDFICKLNYKIDETYYVYFNLSIKDKSTLGAINKPINFPVSISSLKINDNYKFSQANEIIADNYIQIYISDYIKQMISTPDSFKKIESTLHPESIKIMYSTKIILTAKIAKLIEEYIKTEEFYEIIKNAKEDYIKRVLVLINKYGLKQKDFANYELLK